MGVREGALTHSLRAHLRRDMPLKRGDTHIFGRLLLHRRVETQRADRAPIDRDGCAEIRSDHLTLLGFDIIRLVTENRVSREDRGDECRAALNHMRTDRLFS